MEKLFLPFWFLNISYGVCFPSPQAQKCDRPFSPTKKKFDELLPHILNRDKERGKAGQRQQRDPQLRVLPLLPPFSFSLPPPSVPHSIPPRFQHRWAWLDQRPKGSGRVPRSLCSREDTASNQENWLQSGPPSQQLGDLRQIPKPLCVLMWIMRYSWNL